MRKGALLVRQSLWGIGDQAVVALTNLGVGLLLIRTASKEEFGLYGLAIAATLYFVGLANALITTQMVVLAPRFGEREEERFCYGLLKAQHVLHGATVVAAGILLLFAGAADVLATDVSIFIAVVVLASGAILLREFMRRYLYLKQRARAVFAMDLAYSLFVLGGLWVLLSRYVSQDHHVWALVLLGLGSLFVSLPVLLVLHSNASGTGMPWKRCLAKTWPQGRWALGGVTVIWGQNQGFLYLLALLLGSSAVAEVNAARLFMAPASLLSTAANNVTLPALSRHVAARRPGQAASIATRIMLLLLISISGYCLLLLGSQEMLAGWLAMEEYHDLWFLTALWGLVFLLQVLRTRSSLLLQVGQRFRSLMWANVVSAVLVFAGLFPFVSLYQERGSLMAVALGEAVLGLLLWRMVKNAKFEFG